jgi:hypothetical protein
MKKFIILLVAISLAYVSASCADEPFAGEKIEYPSFALHSVLVGNGWVMVLCPEKPLSGKPWVLAPTFYDVRINPVTNMTRTELELVRRGFYVVCASPGVLLGAPDPTKRWDVVYEEMTSKYGLSKRFALMGLSREGLPAARWAAANPGKVSCLYLDKAVCDFKSWPGGKLGVGKGSPQDWETLLKVYNFKDEAEALAFKENPVDLAPKLIADKVPIVYLAGEKDDVVPYVENGARMKEQYEKLGGTFQLIMREGEGHHPHGLKDPAPVVDFIQRYAQ